MNRKLESLATLLEDEDINISAVAMSEILSGNFNRKELRELVSIMQESSLPEQRRLAHQMQAIMRKRKRRHVLSARIKKNNADLLQGMAELHSLWYDENDSREVSKLWNNLLKDAAVKPPRTPRKLAGFMRTAGFGVCDANIQDGDLYCLGAVLEDRIGSPVILAAIARQLAYFFGLKGAVVNVDSSFGILFVTGGGKNNAKCAGVNPRKLKSAILLPADNWSIATTDDFSHCSIMSPGKVLKFISGMLFLNAVCSEGPRYVQLLAGCIAGVKETNTMSGILPYPYAD